MGMARDDIAAGMRHFPVGNYLILYRVLGDGVEVVRYVHGMRRLQDLA
jgi:toxin ParE1/3/4